MRKAIIVVAATALLVGAVSRAVLADPVSDCGTIEGKAINNLFVAIFKEAGRACGKGSAMAPLAISQPAVAAAAGKFYTAIAKGLNKDGTASCFVTLENLDSSGIHIEPKDVLSSMRGLADSACLVP